MMKSRSLGALIALLSFHLSLVCSAPILASSTDAYRTHPEMSPLPEYVVFERRDRLELEKSPDVAPALAAAEAHARALWPTLVRELDVVALSRWHVDATRGFELPAETAFEARILGRDASGALHVDLRGPRLPARYEIVHRHLHLLAVVRPDGGVEQVGVTIRTRIYE